MEYRSHMPGPGGDHFLKSQDQNQGGNLKILLSVASTPKSHARPGGDHFALKPP
jgi:hypothetical protein